MNVILEILKYVLPAMIVLITAYFLIKSFLDQETKKTMLEVKKQNQKMITPVRLQAYERMVLFLERINPESLLVRLQVQGQNSSQLHRELLSLVRAEYEHNLSQQIYLSPQSWTLIKNAKENIIKLINTAGDRVKPESPSIELAGLIIEMHAQLEASPINISLTFIKEEVAREF
ncbi:MAG: hypothetical protein CVU05_04080 [Bacteroidetes bacterium HGW-Bacteroidetes-21]|jgi:hypothetical protein|nr:MAG: hypothetical protein CVU05_04080 [Bacteroidetes bacterium HGW-Bacteroidetes-21]